MTKQLLYFVYGGGSSYIQEAKFSILTALDRLPERDWAMIRVMTDRPQDFAGWPVTTTELSAAQLSVWAGEHGYTHRKKACAIAAGLELADKTIFIDSDTFFTADPSHLFDRVGDGHYLVDSFEWTWEATAGFKEFVRLRAALVEKGAMPSDDTKMYNSGVCGLTRNDGPLLERSISLIDEWHAFCDEVPIVEQVALSVALHGRTVHEANRSVRHYFSSKRYFHAMLALFFARYGENYRPELVALSREVPRCKPYPSAPWRLWAKWKLRRVGRPNRKPARSILYGCLLRGDVYSQACRSAWWDGAIQDMKGGDLEEAFASGAWPEGLARPPDAASEQAALDYFNQRLTALSRARA